MKVFILKSNERLREDVPWNVISCMQNDFQTRIHIEPTQVSIKKRWLAWLIPDNPYNRMQAANLYSAYSVLESDIQVSQGNTHDPELEAEKKKSAELQKKLDELNNPKTPEAPKEPEKEDSNKSMNNMEKKKAKDALKAKLNAAGKTFPPTASLPMLQDLAAGL
jgi:hypothetical protein